MSEKSKKSSKIPYIPRFSYQYCLGKIIAFNRFDSRPCGPSKFATEALGLKSTGTVRTAFSCLNNLNWISTNGRGKYDLTDLGRKIARAAELGVKSEESNLARETMTNVHSLEALANHLKIKKRGTSTEIQEYIASTWGEHYKFSRKYLESLARNMISFLEAAEIIRYDPKGKTYVYVEGEVEVTPPPLIKKRGKKPIRTLAEEKSKETKIDGIPIRLDIQVSEKTDVEELIKKVRAVKAMLKEELSESK